MKLIRSNYNNKSKMTGKERIAAALRGDKPDKIPIMLHNFMLAAKEANVSMEEYRNDPRRIAQVFIQAVERYKYDGILIDIDTVTLAGACGVPVDYPKNDPARSHRGNLEQYADLDTLKLPDLSAYKYTSIWLEATRLLKNHFGEEIYIRGNCDQSPFSLASMIRGTQNWMMDFYMEDESLIFQLLDYCKEVTCQFVELMCQTGADMVSNGDSPAGPDMIPPDMYVKYALPSQKKVVEVAHRNKLPYVLHICGNTESILPYMIESGADGLELDYKTDVNKAFDLMHDRCTFIGNIDPSGVLAMGSVREVEDATKALLKIYARTNRFIANAGCAIPPTAPEENLKAFIATVRNFEN